MSALKFGAIVRFYVRNRLGIDTDTEDGSKLADEFAEMAESMPDKPLKAIVPEFWRRNAERIEAVQRP